MEVDTSKQLRDRRCLDNRRLKARLIDWLLIGLPLLVLPWILFGEFSWLVQFVALGLEISYFFILESVRGQTIGKRRMGVRVISPDGSPPSTNSIAARNVIRPLEEPILALIVMVCSRGRRQRIGDFVGTTAVGSVVYSVPPRRTRMVYLYPCIWIAAAVLLGLVIGSPRETYIQQVNKICAANVERFAGVQIPAGQAVRVHLHEARDVEALNPPGEEAFRSAQIEKLIREEADAWYATWYRANSSKTPDRTFRQLYPPLSRITIRIHGELLALGVHCNPALVERYPG